MKLVPIEMPLTGCAGAAGGTKWTFNRLSFLPDDLILVWVYSALSPSLRITSGINVSEFFFFQDSPLRVRSKGETFCLRVKIKYRKTRECFGCLALI